MRPTFFLHVPKTAGMALRSVLMVGLPSERVLFGDYAQITPKIGPGYDLIQGHVYLRDVAWVALGGYFKMTVLRDPLEQAISNFYHIKKRYFLNRRLVPTEQLDALVMGLAKAVDSGQFVHTLDTALQHFSDLPRHAPMTEHVLAASLTLSKFDAVGFKSHIDAFVQALGPALGFKVPELLPEVNLSEWKPGQDELTEAQKEQIKERWLQGDYAFYDFARTMFSFYGTVAGVSCSQRA